MVARYQNDKVRQPLHIWSFEGAGILTHYLVKYDGKRRTKWPIPVSGLDAKDIVVKIVPYIRFPNERIETRRHCLVFGSCRNWLQEG